MKIIIACIILIEYCKTKLRKKMTFMCVFFYNNVESNIFHNLRSFSFERTSKDFPERLIRFIYIWKKIAYINDSLIYTEEIFEKELVTITRTFNQNGKNSVFTRKNHIFWFYFSCLKTGYKLRSTKSCLVLKR